MEDCRDRGAENKDYEGQDVTKINKEKEGLPG